MKQETVINSKQVKVEHKVGKRMGIFMIIIGAITLIGTSGFTIAGHSPWMLIALAPIYWIGLSAYRCYKEDGRLSRRVLSIAVFAVLPFAYLAAMTLGYSISGLWPLGVMIVGISFVLLGSSK